MKSLPPTSALYQLARELGVSPATLVIKLRSVGLDPSSQFVASERSEQAAPALGAPQAETGRPEIAPTPAVPSFGAGATEVEVTRSPAAPSFDTGSNKVVKHSELRPTRRAPRAEPSAPSLYAAAFAVRDEPVEESVARESAPSSAEAKGPAPNSVPPHAVAALAQRPAPRSPDTVPHVATDTQRPPGPAAVSVPLVRAKRTPATPSPTLATASPASGRPFQTATPAAERPAQTASRPRRRLWRDAAGALVGAAACALVVFAFAQQDSDPQFAAVSPGAVASAPTPGPAPAVLPPQLPEAPTRESAVDPSASTTAAAPEPVAEPDERLASLLINASSPTPMQLVLRCQRVSGGVVPDDELHASSGQWLEALPPGRYRVVGLSETHYGSATVDVEPPQTVCDLSVVELGAVSFDLRSEQGPVADAQIVLLPPSEALDLGLRVLPAEGTHRLPPGRWSVRVRASGFAAARLDVAVEPAGSHRVDVTLRAEHVSTVLGSSPGSPAILAGPAGASLDRQGDDLFARGLARDDEATVLVRLDDGRIGRAQLPGSTDRALARAELPVRIQGYAVGPDGNAARAGLEVRAVHALAQDRELTCVGSDGGLELLDVRVQTDATGSFELTGLPAGAWTVSAGDAEARLVLAPGETTRALIKLP